LLHDLGSWLTLLTAPCELTPQLAAHASKGLSLIAVTGGASGVLTAAAASAVTGVGADAVDAAEAGPLAAAVTGAVAGAMGRDAIGATTEGLTRAEAATIEEAMAGGWSAVGEVDASTGAVPLRAAAVALDKAASAAAALVELASFVGTIGV